MSNYTSMQLADTMHRGLEQCNLDMILGCYADDAEMQVVDQKHPPSSPLTMKGKKAISDYYKDICGRDMTHHIEREIVADNEMSLTEECCYPDGTRVLAAETFELSNGKIKRQTNVQAWDE